MKLIIIFLSLLVNNQLFAQNQNMSNGFIFDGEPYLTVNPYNSQHLVIAWMGFQYGNQVVIKTSSSFNGGIDWSSSTYVPHTTTGFTSADPSLQFDQNGNVFVCFIDYSPYMTAGAVYVAKSTNGGLTWGTPVEVISMTDDPGKLCIDRPWMVIDRNAGVNQGNIYVTTMNSNILYVAPPYNPYFTCSTNGGNSFNQPRYLDTISWLAGSYITQPVPTPSVSTSGKFFAVYPSYVISQSLYAQYFIATSDDAGTDFTYHTVEATADAASDNLCKKGPLLLCDPSDADHLVFLHLLETNGDIDVFFVESSNGGTTWTTPERINDDPVSNGIMQDMVWGDFDDDGDLAVCWRDRRTSQTSGYEVPTEIWGAIRWKDSVSFSSNLKISDVAATHDTVLNSSGNDFMCVQFTNDTLYAVWGDVRTGKLNIWFNRMAVSNGSTFISKIVCEQANEINAYPNPVNELVYLKDIKIPFSYKITDAEGRLLKSEKNTKNNSVNTANLKPGIYFLNIDSEDGFSTIRLIKN